MSRKKKVEDRPAQVLDRAAMSVVDAASKDRVPVESRNWLDMVVIVGDRAFAADGFILAGADLPKVDPEKVQAGAERVEKAFVPWIVAEAVRRSDPPKVGEAIFQGGRLNWKERGLELSGVLPTETRAASKVIEAWESNDSIERPSMVLMSIELLKKIVRVMEGFHSGTSDYPGIRLSIGNENQSVRFATKREDGRVCDVFLMPMIDEEALRRARKDAEAVNKRRSKESNGHE